MMRDRREEILQRLVEIATCLVGKDAVFRNTDHPPESPRPAIVINDGDEADDIDGQQPARRRNQRIAMTPEIILHVAGKDSAEITCARSTLRLQLIEAIGVDEELREITGQNGDVRYTGFGTHDALGRRLMAEAGVAFTFVYPLLFGEIEQ